MSIVFSTLNLGGVQLKNRFVRSATWEGMCDAQGHVSPRLVAHCRALAEGGAALLVSGYAVVRPEGIQLPGSMKLFEPGCEEGLRALADAVHEGGAKMFAQLVHVGNQGSSKLSGCPPIAPSAVGDAGSTEVPLAMSPEDIAEVVTAFASAAKRCKACGFDGVQLHGAHGYLIGQFLSPLTNRRDDSYGGSLENRMRFLLEVLAAVRQAVGADFPVTIKLNGGDNMDGAFTLDEALTVARRLEEGGIAAIEVSSGTGAAGKLGPCRANLTQPSQEDYNLEAARALKAAVGVPVFAVGGIRTLSRSEEALGKGDIDGIALSRPLIREPHLVNLWKQNPEYRAACISCNGCFRPGLKEGGIRCVQEPPA